MVKCRMKRERVKLEKLEGEGAKEEEGAAVKASTKYFDCVASKIFREVVACCDVEPPIGFEPMTSALRKRRSSQLS